MRTMLPIIPALICGLMALGCGDPTTVSIARVVVTAPASTVQFGKLVQLTARPLDSSGQAVDGKPAHWSSSNTAVASVSASGLVQAVALGSAVIRAEVSGVAGEMAITVVPVPAASVSILNAPTNGIAGKTLQLGAVTRDAEGNSLPGRTVEWSTSSPEIGTVNAAGLVTFLAPGMLEIVARVEGVQGTAMVSVSNPPPARVQFPLPYAEVDVGKSTSIRVVVTASDGDTLRRPDIEWSVLDGAVASVDATGAIRGTASGTARIVARSGAAADTALLVAVPSNGLIGTAFVSGSPRATARAGDLVTVDISLDLSRASPEGDLGASEFELAYDSTLFTYERVASPASGSVATNPAVRGRVRVAFASTAKQGAGDVVLARISFRTAAAAPEGARRTFGLTFTARPVSTGFTAYLLPVPAAATVIIRTQ
jgi:uncharacterized protein YjdB